MLASMPSPPIFDGNVLFPDVGTQWTLDDFFPDIGAYLPPDSPFPVVDEHWMGGDDTDGVFPSTAATLECDEVMPADEDVADIPCPDMDNLPPAPWEVNDRPSDTLPQLLPFEGADVKRTEGMITFSRGCTRPADGLKMIHSVSLFGNEKANFQFKPVYKKDVSSKTSKVRRGPYKTKRRLLACEKMKASLAVENVAPKFMCLNCLSHVVNLSDHICQEKPK